MPAPAAKRAIPVDIPTRRGFHRIFTPHPLSLSSSTLLSILSTALCPHPWRVAAVTHRDADHGRRAVRYQASCGPGAPRTKRMLLIMVASVLELASHLRIRSSFSSLHYPGGLLPPPPPPSLRPSRATSTGRSTSLPPPPARPSPPPPLPSRQALGDTRAGRSAGPARDLLRLQQSPHPPGRRALGAAQPGGSAGPPHSPARIMPGPSDPGYPEAAARGRPRPPPCRPQIWLVSWPPPSRRTPSAPASLHCGRYLHHVQCLRWAPGLTLGCTFSWCCRIGCVRRGGVSRSCLCLIQQAGAASSHWR